MTKQVCLYVCLSVRPIWKPIFAEKLIYREALHSYYSYSVFLVLDPRGKIRLHLQFWNRWGRFWPVQRHRAWCGEKRTSCFGPPLRPWGTKASGRPVPHRIRRLFFVASSFENAQVRPENDLLTIGKIIKVALSAALKQTAARDLEPRSMLYLRRTFPRKKNKVARHFNYDVTTQYSYTI